MNYSCVLILVWSICAPAALSQVHLLTGSPYSAGDAAFASALLRVEENGTVTIVADVVPESVGTEWIGVSYDLRKAVLLTTYRDSAVIVVDFDRAAVTKKCKWSESGGRALMFSWLATPPAPGPSFEWLETGPNVLKDAVVQGMLLDPVV